MEEEREREREREKVIKYKDQRCTSKWKETTNNKRAEHQLAGAAYSAIC